MKENERKTNPKGTGASYSKELTLNKTHLAILETLQKNDGLTKLEITRRLNESAQEQKAPFVAGCSVSGRLSELCGAQLVKMRYCKVEVRDYASRQYRFRKKPTWYLTDNAKELLKERSQCNAVQ
jgi:hypothetical protein